MLIGYKHAYASSRSAALQALLVTGSGGMALLAGLILMSIVGGSLELSVLLQQGEVIQASGLYLPILILVALGCFTKSAQFPFHFWLPSAMAAPTPVSAYLHSATMVKAGVYLLARLSPALGGTPSWQVVLTTFGAVTMFLGAYLAILQVDLKRILAFTTVSALGTLVMLVGIGTEYAIKAAMVFLVVHSLYKGCLFMVAGSIDHESGTRDISLLSGLRKAMPITAAAAALGALSMSGIPPLYGFIGKEVIYDATLQSPIATFLVTAVTVMGKMLMIVAAGMVAIKPFYGHPVSTPKKAHEAPWSMLLGPVVLAGLSLLLGLGWAPSKGFSLENIGSLAEPITNQAVGAILSAETHIHLYLIPSYIDLKVILSALTIVVGVAAYFYARNALFYSGQPLRGAIEMAPERAYTNTVEGMQALARWQTRMLQSGDLRRYLVIVISTTVLLTGFALLWFWNLNALRLAPLEADIYTWMIALVILGGAIFMTMAQTRLSAVAALGAVGYGVALLFMINSAPDLAMTQFSIETLSVVLFVLVLYRLPELTFKSNVPTRLRDAIVAVAAGALMTMLLLAVNSYPPEARLSPYFAENSYVEAHGRNVVNVILVDFRALDTLGEIAVIGIGAIGILALLKLRPQKEQYTDSESENKLEEPSS